MGRSRTKSNAAEDGLFFLPLGGAGEIGMNLNLFRFDGKWLMVDLGITFGDDTTPGIDVIAPDPAFIEERADDLVGLILTHAHEDHIGAVPYLWDRLRCPMWATPFTAAVLRRKLAEAGLEEEAEVNVVDMGSRFDVGPFNIELVTLTHSIPEPNALVIRTNAGTVLHTGDWKLDPKPLIGDPPDVDALRRLGDEGVLALVGDSTNVFREGEAGSESDVRDSLIKLVGDLPNRVAIASFASNVARLETIAVAARETGRSPALVGRSLWRMYEAAKETGYLKGIRFLDEQEVMSLPRDKVLMACTGSQGEPRAALARIASESHPHVRLASGDTVIFSSRIIPGNELAIGRLHDSLISQGVEVITERDHFVHVSGHPARDELAQMYQWTRPRIAIPVHGEARHMHEHARLAESCQVAQTIVALNGQMVRLAPGAPEIVETVRAGRLAYDGGDMVALDSEPLRERKRMMFNGAMTVSLVVDMDGRLLADPIVGVRGLFDPDEDTELMEMLHDTVEAALEELPRARRKDNYHIQDQVRKSVRRLIRAELNKRPETDVHVMRMER